MSPIHIIELCMTIALLFYFAAYFVARKGGKHWYLHIGVAITALTLDVYGTYIMFNMSEDIRWSFHTISSMVAILLFGVQAFLGMKRLKKLHVLFAKWIFLPTWAVSFSSGFFQ